MKRNTYSIYDFWDEAIHPMPLWVEVWRGNVKEIVDAHNVKGAITIALAYQACGGDQWCICDETAARPRRPLKSWEKKTGPSYAEDFADQIRRGVIKLPNSAFMIKGKLPGLGA